MKRIIVILLTVAAVVFSACEELLPGGGSFVFTLDDAEVTDGQHFDMNVGDFFYLGHTIRGERQGWDDIFLCSVSDPSVVSFITNQMVASHGGSTTVTLNANGNEVTFSVSVPETPHGTIYFACHQNWRDGEEDMSGLNLPPFSDSLYVNGKKTPEPCNILVSDTDGTLWQGFFKSDFVENGAYYENGTISLKCNGREVVSKRPFDIPYFKRNCFRARHGKLYLIGNNKDWTSFNYAIVSADGTWKEGTVNADWNSEFHWKEVGLYDIDEDDKGNVILWGFCFHTSYLTKPYVWTVAPDGSISGRELPFRISPEMMAAFDSEGNSHLFCPMGDYALFYKNETAYQQINNWLLSSKMIVRGTDVWTAFYAQEEKDVYDDWGLYIVKNDELIQLKTKLAFADDMDFCLSSKGDPYIVYTMDQANGLCVMKGEIPVLFIPIVNCKDIKLAVVD